LVNEEQKRCAAKGRKIKDTQKKEHTLGEGKKPLKKKLKEKKKSGYKKGKL